MVGVLERDAKKDRNLLDDFDDLKERVSILERYPSSDTTVSFLIAANDAHSSIKSQADYICDGTADNIEIQTAINVLEIAGGGKVILSEGTFSLNAYVQAKTSVSIVGMGFGSILQVASGVDAHGIYSYNATDYYVANLAIDVSLSGSGAAGGGSTPCGIFLGHSVNHTKGNVQFRNLYIEGADEVGIITLSCDHIYIVDCIVEDCTFAGIHTDTQDYVVIRGNIVRNCESYGIRITANTDYSIVADNVIEGCGKSGTVSLSVVDSNYTTVTGNVVKDSATANSIGISLEAAITSACDFNTVVSNTVLMETSVYAGINLEKAASNTITGNNITGSAAYGVRENGAGVDANLIQNNYLSGTTAGVIVVGSNTVVKDNIGYLTENSGTDNIASGNTTKQVAHGLAATPTVIIIAFREQGDNDYGRWWIDTIGATNFTLNVSADPGASNLDFAWEAKVR